MLVAIILLTITHSVFIQASEVHIEQGTLHGTVLKSRNGHEFYGFYGIPYAQPPVGKLRFQPPKLPPPSWKGTKNATEKPPFCPQMSPSITEGYTESEDCLYLQVFTQKVNPAMNAKLKPVLVWFHGGSFKEGGSTLYEPHFFMDKPIVLVWVNSRLNVFGFFSTGEASYPGNYGLKDQTASLRWIQKNIRHFGGDPAAVTIMGQSSGSACVSHHTLSPLSKGTFHRAILHSGSANAFWAVTPTERAQRNFQSFRQLANCSRSSTNESVACLRAIPFKELAQIASTFKDVDSRSYPFNPVIEPFGDKGAFVPRDPTNPFNYHGSRLPLIIGFTTNEDSVRKIQNPLNVTDAKLFDSLLFKALYYKPRPDRESLAKNTTSLVKQIYFGNDFTKNTYKTAITILSDLHFRFALLDAIHSYPYKVFAYEYDYRDSPLSRELGVGHSGEIKMIFPKFSEPLTDEENRVSETMITYWSNFIMTGNPNTPNKTLPTAWPGAKTGVDGHHLRLMHIANDGFHVKKVSLREQAELWPYYKKINYAYQ